MKKLAFLVSLVFLVSAFSFMPSSEVNGATQLVGHSESSTYAGKTMSIYVQEPKTNEAYSGTTKMPAVIFLHDQNGQGKVDSLLASPGSANALPVSVDDSLDVPMFVICPKSTDGTADWSKDSDVLLNAISSLVTKYNIDSKRVFLMGYNAGANGAIAVAIKSPSTFAGIIAAKVTKNPGKTLSKLVNVPTWIFQGKTDVFYKTSLDVYQKLQDGGTNVTFTTIGSGCAKKELIFDNFAISWMLTKPDRFAAPTVLPSPGHSIAMATLDSRELKYYLQFPRLKTSPAVEDGVKYPLVVDLHGSGGHEVLDQLFNGEIGVVGLDHVRDNTVLPFYRVYPRLPTNGNNYATSWGGVADLVNKMIDDISATYSIDTNRIYLTGFSMGGYGTWDVAMKYPDKFAAIMPCAGRTAAIDQIYKLRHIPTYVMHGAYDNIVRFDEGKACAERMLRVNPKTIFSIYNVDHKLITEMRSEGAFQWLLQQNKANNVKTPVPTSYRLPPAPKVQKVENGSDVVYGKASPKLNVYLKIKGIVISQAYSEENGDYFFVLDRTLKTGEVLSVYAMGLYGKAGKSTVITVKKAT